MWGRGQENYEERPKNARNQDDCGLLERDGNLRYERKIKWQWCFKWCLCCSSSKWQLLIRLFLELQAEGYLMLAHHFGLE
ncbi:hypothetical protein BVX99_01715 [bacterium F16]|nr:hypothetical protein BVX99_01715 [bacterium F16]